MVFKVGETVVYPHHGAALIEAIETRVIKMLPGDYEVVGRRKGYRDVNMLLQVRNGTTPPVVQVACNVSADRF